MNAAGGSGYHLWLTGLVQGVGFRPLAWQLARAAGLAGRVCNAPDGLHIWLRADGPTAEAFLQQLLAQAPPLARVQQAVISSENQLYFSDFQIVESKTTATPSLLLPPDVALCTACRAELADPANRRYGYAFTTCTHCGPRYSILTALPYDRPHTAMQPFVNCEDCQREFNDPTDRRFYAQTLSCPQCAVPLWAADATGTRLTDVPETALQTALTALENGQVVAAKGIGGYLLLTDATRPEAVQRLRQRKHRPRKPLAVLYASLAALRADCHVQPDEAEALTGPVSPIVLLPLSLIHI